MPPRRSRRPQAATVAEHLNAITDTADIVVALDRLQSLAPAVESVSMVVAWFGDDLRAGSCKMRPGVEVAAKTTTPLAWSVNGIACADAFLVSRDAEDRPVYGDTPADFAVVQAVQEMKAHGLRVTCYPFILMDVPPGSTKPNPYRANAATPRPPTFPARAHHLFPCGRLCRIGGQVRNCRHTGLCPVRHNHARQLQRFGDQCELDRPDGRMRLAPDHPALCAAVQSGGWCGAFLIGQRCPTCPPSAAGPKIGYAADWSEHFGHHPANSSGAR